MKHRHTAQNAGMLDIHMRPERHNAVNVLVFFDVGGSMDEHVQVVDRCSVPCTASSSIWSFTISTTASTRACGKTIADASGKLLM